METMRHFEFIKHHDELIYGGKLVSEDEVSAEQLITRIQESIPKPQATAEKKVKLLNKGINE